MCAITSFAQLRDAGKIGEDDADAEILERELGAPQPWRSAAALGLAAAALRGSAYAEARRRLLGEQAEAVEAARARLKIRSGFERLSADDAHGVLRPLQEALTDTTAEAVAPTLAELRGRFPRRVAEAEEKAATTPSTTSSLARSPPCPPGSASPSSRWILGSRGARSRPESSSTRRSPICARASWPGSSAARGCASYDAAHPRSQGPPGEDRARAAHADPPRPSRRRRERLPARPFPWRRPASGRGAPGPAPEARRSGPDERARASGAKGAKELAAGRERGAAAGRQKEAWGPPCSTGYACSARWRRTASRGPALVTGGWKSQGYRELRETSAPR